ncbi:DUF397 domain-containing protein [Nocardia jiangxiensis]|uniref:DUF397 domain-containing protein n=1 Tax=Nocardia jiangxiensis TaxID=282685 RepID=A0ABW6RSS5_9NOCA
MIVDLSGARWFKSSRSVSGGDCVEVAHLNGGKVGVRDSKNPAGPALIFGSAEWDVFTDRLAEGGFDR